MLVWGFGPAMAGCWLSSWLSPNLLFLGLEPHFLALSPGVAARLGLPGPPHLLGPLLLRARGTLGPEGPEGAGSELLSPGGFTVECGGLWGDPDPPPPLELGELSSRPGARAGPCSRSAT